jgi:hypothetical protein
LWRRRRVELPRQPAAEQRSGGREIEELRDPPHLRGITDGICRRRGRRFGSRGRFVSPTFARVAETAAFVASDRAGAMTARVINFSAGSIAD